MACYGTVSPSIFTSTSWFRLEDISTFQTCPHECETADPVRGTPASSSTRRLGSCLMIIQERVAGGFNYLRRSHSHFQSVPVQVISCKCRSALGSKTLDIMSSYHTWGADVLRTNPEVPWSPASHKSMSDGSSLTLCSFLAILASCHEAFHKNS